MLVEVTQEDREAAADLLYRGGTTTYLLCREGKMDTTPGVQAFARHRQAAVQKARADALEEVEKVGKAIEKAIWTDNQVYWSMERGTPFPATARNALARAALAALSSPDR